MPFHVHGPESHFFLQQAIDIPSTMMALNNSTRITVGTYPDATAAINLANGVTSGVSFPLFVPPNFASGMTINILWSPSANDAVAHSVVWSRYALTMSVGANMAGVVVVPSVWTSTAQVNTQNILVQDTVTLIPFFEGLLQGGLLGNGVWVRFNLLRNGADVADTLVADVQLYGVHFDYLGTD